MNVFPKFREDEWISNTATFKKVVSGDVITVEKKGKDPFKLRSYAKFFFSANSLPRLGRGKDSSAVMDRLVIIPFDAKFTKNRKNIWTTENGHSQLIGIKDIPGSIIVKPVLISGDTIVRDIKKAEEIKTKISENNANYYFDYELDFYVLPKDMPEYTAIKIETSEELLDYLTNNRTGAGYIEENVILLLDGNFELPRVDSISLQSTSMIIGLGESGAIIKNISEADYEYSIIKQNYGVIAGVTFDSYNFANKSSYNGAFSPIDINNGIIYKVGFANYMVSGGPAKNVSGFVNENYGVIHYANINNFDLSSILNLSKICIRNVGQIHANYVIGSGSAQANNISIIFYNKD